MKRLNDKGAALATVVITIAILGILAAIALYLSLVTYQTKITDYKVKNNFYSAETVLDGMVLSVQDSVSEAFVAAYDRIMSQYNLLTKADADSDIATIFQETFVSILSEDLKTNLSSSQLSDSPENYYNMKKLLKYVDKGLLRVDAAFNDLAVNTYPYAVVQAAGSVEVGDSAYDNNDGRLTRWYKEKKNELGQNVRVLDRVELAGIRVEYTDEAGIVSVIETDINIAIPEMNFVMPKDMPETFKYSLIGNSGIEIKGNSSVSGNIYAGSLVAAKRGTGLVSLNITNNAKLDLSNSSYFVAEGDIKVGSGATFTSDSTSQIWTNNISVENGTASLAGSTYVADDLTLSSVNSTVNLTGRYIGFGNSMDTPEKSSAIIINGKNSKLDLSGLDELFIAGYSFIKTNQSGNNVTGENVNMGESITLKGNQIAYLVPVECIKGYNTNPIAVARTTNINLNDVIDVNAEIERAGHNLRYYMDKANVNTIDKAIQKVVVTTGNDSLVYLYVSLPEGVATDYCRDYFGGKTPEKINTYASYFADSIKVNAGDDSNVSVYTAGNYSVFDGENMTLAGAKNGEDVLRKVGLYEKAYKSLRETLKTNYADDDSAGVDASTSSTVFEYLIDSAEFDRYLPLGTGNRSRQKVVTSSQNGLKAVLFTSRKDANGAYEQPYTYDGDNKVCLIVAKSDVVIPKNFSGTIICTGKITVQDNANIEATSSQEGIVALLEQDDLKSIFVNGDSYGAQLNGNSNNTGKSDIDYSEIIYYSNWTKK